VPDSDPLKELLLRTSELYRALAEHLDPAEFDDSPHARFTHSTIVLAMEHGMSVMMLVEAGQLSSANAVLRAQLEATVRSAWLLYVATDEWVINYVEKAERNPLKDPNGAPTIEKTIQQIELKASKGLAPKAVAPQLRLFKELAWGPLNSFVHSGIHPTMLQTTGYPLDGALNTVKNASALAVICGMLIAALSGSQALVDGMNGIQAAYLDCCHVLGRN
jgi:hypothetical protein